MSIVTFYRRQTTPVRLTYSNARIMTKVRAMRPTGMIAMVMMMVPRTPPHMAMISPVIPMMTIISTPRTSVVGIPHHIVPIIPIARCREHIGIHAVIIDIPIPTGP
jgi:hypothetical protein